MTDVFRTHELTIDESTKIKLEQKPVSEIFKFNTQAYICTGSSGCGKTTLSVDLIYRYSEECTNIYYVTSTKESVSDNYIGLIPKAFRRLPTCANISNIWQEIKSTFEAFDVPQNDITQIIIALYGETIAHKIENNIHDKIEEIKEKNTLLYKNMKKNQNDIIQLVNQDINAFKYELNRMILLHGIEENGNNMLTTKQLLIVNGLISRPPKTLLILDDVTSELESSKTSKVKIHYDGKSMLEREIFQSILTDILTRSRHYNCLVIFFTHTLDIFTSAKDRITNIVCFDSTSAKKVTLSKTYGERDKKTLRSGSDYLFGNDMYKHMFLYYNFSEAKICVGKADLHDTPIKLGEMCKEYVKAYDIASSGYKDIVQSIDNIDDDDNEYDDDDVPIIDSSVF